MKGKGKGKEQIEYRDCPLQFPDFTPIDHTRLCSRYTSALQRDENEGIGVEDLDVLQHELEALLVSVTKRRDKLEEEMQLLVTWQEKKEKKHTGKAEPESSTKRSRPSEGKPTKKYKDGTGKAHSINTMCRHKSKNVQARMQEYEFTDSPLDAFKNQKNDTPNQFWTSVEPYFAEITPDHIKFLEDMIKSHENDAEYQKIPPRGKHVSHKWSHKDASKEKKEGSKTSERRKGLINNPFVNSGHEDKKPKKAEKDSDSTSPFGTLTQRLVSCLLEENVTSSDDKVIDNVKEKSDGKATRPHSKRSFIKSLKIENAALLEERIRKELEEHGLLDAEDTEAENSEDELLSELKKTQASLKSVSAHNLSQAKKLLKVAKEEFARQEIKKKLQALDTEVIDIQRKMSLAKQKKRSSTKKEKEHAMKVLKERENLIKQLRKMGYSY